MFTNFKMDIKNLKGLLPFSWFIIFIFLDISCSKEIDYDLTEEALIPFELLEGKIAFYRGQGRIGIINAENKTLQHVYTKDSASIWKASLNYSPDGTKFVYAGYHFTYNAYTIFTMNAEGGGHKALTSPGSQSFHGFAPVWSPDGQWIYYIIGNSNNGNVYKVRIDGTGFQQVTDFDVNGRVSISSDGKLIALCKSHQHKTEGVFIYQQSNKEIKKIAEHDSTMIVQSPCFSPDNKKIAYVSMHGPNQWPNQSQPYYSRLHIVDIASGEENMTFELPFKDGQTTTIYLNWSPDGEQLAFNYSAGVSENKHWPIYIINKDGTGMQQISQNTRPSPVIDGAPSWSK